MLALFLAVLTTTTKLKGVDLVPVATMSAECNKPNCWECPSATTPIYVKNIGNATDARQIVVTIKRETQTLVSWTTTAPAAGQQVRVGFYTTFPWNCPPIPQGPCTADHTYHITVDATNAVPESNEQNNTKDLCIRYPDRTTFHVNIFPNK